MVNSQMNIANIDNFLIRSKIPIKDLVLNTSLNIRVNILIWFFMMNSSKT